MSNFQNKETSIFSKIAKRNSPYQKVAVTLAIMFIYTYSQSIPLTGIDQVALKKAFSEFSGNNPLLQILSMYTGTGGGNKNVIISPFSLGIIPFINASIFIDLLTSILPALEKLQTEEGELGRRKIAFYKKILTFFFSIIQSGFFLNAIKSYLFSSNPFLLFLIGLQLVFGAMVMVWLSNLIDNKGIGNGTSIFIFINIISTLINKNIFFQTEINFSYLLQLIVLYIILVFIVAAQNARITIDVVSARQLAYLENSGKKKGNTNEEKIALTKQSGLSVRFNQAGIFPIIIASNIIPFLSYFIQNIFPGIFASLFTNLLYYLLIIGFNYFYTIVFWDPEKISEQLRKSSVSILNVTPGKETVRYLESMVFSASILGGISLCLILFSFDVLKHLINGSILNEINVSSLIILVGVCFEIQRTIQGLFKNILPNSILKSFNQ